MSVIIVIISACPMKRLLLWMHYSECSILSVYAGRLHLNRQVIVLMSGLGVSNQAFFALQDNMLQKLANMLIRENLATDALAEVKSRLVCQFIDQNFKTQS